MKQLNWGLTGAVVLCLAIVLLAGCGVPQSEYDALQADYDALNANYEAAQNELAELEAVYPPKDFPSLSALEDWLLDNDVSEKPDTTSLQAWYGRALEVQEDALADGYVVSVCYDYYSQTDTYGVWCVTIINGKMFYWDPETDEVLEDTAIGTVK